jgi:hypothetical protein
MITFFTRLLAFTFFCCLFSSAQAQEEKSNNNPASQGGGAISLVPAGASFPDLGVLQPEAQQLGFYGKKTCEWINAHESEFKELVVACKDCKRISTADVGLYGEASIIRLKEVINALAPALQMQMKGHESYYPDLHGTGVLHSQITFVVSQKDFELIQKEISKAR